MATKKSGTTTRKSTTKTTKSATTVSPKAEKVEKVEQVIVEERKTEEQPIVKEVLYTNSGDKMMSIIHLSTGRTPVSYGNGKKKVFKGYGDKFSISTREFEQEFAPSSVGEALLKQKILAVGEDCPQEIKDRLDINFDEKELLSPRAYRELLTLPTEDVCNLFKDLCMEHKYMVVRCFADDLETNDGRNCHRDKITKLNDISKAYVNVERGERGMFANILEEMSNRESKKY